MELVTPDIGLLFWMLLSFSIVLIILRKFAWKPILKALKDREESIETALENAAKAREEIADLKKNKDIIFKEQNDYKLELIKNAKEEADEYKRAKNQKTDEQTKQNLTVAKEIINQEKRAAILEIKDTVADLSINIAEKILQKELEKDIEHINIINKSLEDLEIK